MSKKKKQKYDGVVYSTDENFTYSAFDSLAEPDTLPIDKQRLRIVYEKKGRNGKPVTLIKGFVGKKDDKENLAKIIKQNCGVGGGVKDDEILIQGNSVDKVKNVLQSLGYKTS